MNGETGIVMRLPPIIIDNATMPLTERSRPAVSTTSA
jgi:hypothetical protein